MLCIAWYTMPVVRHVISTDLFRILQYLQSVLLQKLKSDLLVEVPVGLGFRFKGREAFGCIALGFSESLVRNCSILICFTSRAIGSRLVVACSVTFSVIWLGLHFSSLALRGIAALTKNSLRFLGHLYPTINLFWWMCVVVELIPQNN